MTVKKRFNSFFRQNLKQKNFLWNVHKQVQVQNLIILIKLRLLS
jgi:hypothetical protein